MVEKENENPNKAGIDEKQPSPEAYELSGEGKDPKNLGNGRWKHLGKTYKEEPIGKS